MSRTVAVSKPRLPAARVLAGRSKLIHAVVATPANVADSTVLPHSAAQRCFQVAEHHNMICQRLAERTEPTSI
jgi:hypothetical protein